MRTTSSSPTSSAPVFVGEVCEVDWAGAASSFCGGGVLSGCLSGAGGSATGPTSAAGVGVGFVLAGCVVAPLLRPDCASGERVAATSRASAHAQAASARASPSAALFLLPSVFIVPRPAARAPRP